MGPTHHRDPRLVLVVAVGGAVGTLARHLVSSASAGGGGFPVTTLGINLVGAFVLGVLLEALLRHGRETDRARRLRLGVGTGVLGGFTTYSTLAVEIERLLTDGQVATAAAYAAASVVLGLLVCGAGVLVGAHGHRLLVLPRDPDTAQEIDPATDDGATGPTGPRRDRPWPGGPR